VTSRSLAHSFRMRWLIATLSLLASALAFGQGTTLASRFKPPPGTQRISLDSLGFGHYLRHLPLKPNGSPVLLHNGLPKRRQGVHAAVIDMSLGPRDLQQCADAVMRLRAEFLFATGRQDEIAFRLTNGFKVEWKRWRQGERVIVNGNQCRWAAGAEPDESHRALLTYLDLVFTYAGTLSLSRELADAQVKPIEPGDVFILGGSPGHAMLVMDVARSADSRAYFLLAQSYMPAQEIHVVVNPNTALGAWYSLDGDALRTPEWTFAWSDRRRWP
jgi:hypothetical protein